MNEKLFVFLLEEVDNQDEELHTHGIFSSYELASEAEEVIIENGEAAFDDSHFSITKYELDS